MRESRIQAVDHVSIEAPFGLDEALRWFYGELASLDEVDAGPEAADALCFRSERIELRILRVHQPRVESTDARVTIAVPSLADVIEQLECRSIPYTRLSGLQRSDRRIQTPDPAGNRVELKQAWRRTVL